MRTVFWALLPALAFSSSLQAAPLSFNRDIRPIFAEYCFACHGPDTAKRKADLRLDTEESAKTVLVAGKPEQSELFLRMAGKGDGKIMPPPSTNKKIAPAQLALVKQWILEGAKYEPHWSFINPTRPTLPMVKDATWPKNAIDRFILARLEQEGLRPSAAADRRILARRLAFDVIGLPPSPEDVEAFVKDTDAKAYEKYLNRLLESKHFGERMALFWLDLVRFADTGGYHSDNHRDIYLYRDYVINSFNNNKPFDRFTIEQLAGDLLPNATAEQRIASGYNRLLMTTEEGGAQPKEYAAKYAADRVRNASGVWLGLTMGCTECHNHKYDPLTTKEFYQFASFWADISEKAVGRQTQTKIATPEMDLELKRLESEIAQVRKQLDTPTPELAAAQKLWEERAKAELASAKPIWSPVRPTKAASSGGATLTVQDDLSVLSTGKNPAKDTYTLTLPTDQKAITGIRLTALRHSSFQGLSRGNGNYILSGFKVSIDGKGKPKPVTITRAVADFEQRGYPIASLLGKKRGAGWAIEGHIRKNEDHSAVFIFSKPIPGGPGTTLTVRMEHTSTYPQHNIGRFRLDLTTAANPSLGDKAGLPQNIVQALNTPVEKRTAAQKDTLAAHYRSIAAELFSTRQKLAKLQAQRADMEKNMPQTLVSIAVAPRMMRVLPRGNWLDDSGEVVKPATPASLPALSFKDRATRLDLANWMVSKQHPLTARVFVNRLWKLFYGQGLVTSMEDFGAQGNWPSHPELLDWLAVEFRDSGWDVKHMVRLMVGSAAYQQTSIATEALRQKDPYNRLLGRQGRFRLDAELVRDNALAISGLLVETLGGPSVKPYQPDGYWAYLNFPTRTYVADKGDNQYRRGLYTYWQRTFPHPSLVAFDAPSREECTADRPRSNTPQQALVLLNDPTYVEAARVLAEKVLKANLKSDEDRLAHAYRQVLHRKPRPAELEVLLPLFQQHLQQYRTDKAEAQSLVTIGQAPLAKDVDVPTLAAWTSITRVLLNLHETITRE